MRFSLKRMLVLTAAVAFTCYSLVYANPVLGDLFYTAAAGAVVLAVIAAIQRHGDRRAFWLGFAIVAAAYLALTAIEKRAAAARYLSQLMTRVSGGGPPGAIGESELITQYLLTACFDRICVSQDPSFGAGRDDPYVRAARVTQRRSAFRQQDPIFAAFLATGHSAIAMLAGWLGGVASRRMYLSRSPSADRPS